MTIQYKSAAFDLTNTNLTTVLSISTSAVAIVKTVQASHQTASNVDVDLYIKKAFMARCFVLTLTIKRGPENERSSHDDVGT